MLPTDTGVTDPTSGSIEALVAWVVLHVRSTGSVSPKNSVGLASRCAVGLMLTVTLAVAVAGVSRRCGWSACRWCWWWA